MMNLKIKKTLSLNGTVLIPSSKSMSIRCLLFSLLAQGHSMLNNVLECDDVQMALSVCQLLGASIHSEEASIIVKSEGLPLQFSATEINTGNSGITTVFTLPLLGLRDNYSDPVMLDCGEQMRARPVKSLLHALRKLGMDITCIKQQDQLPV